METTVMAFSARQPGKATHVQLERAYEASGLACSLEEALRNPTLARLLEITAEAWARPAQAPPCEYRPPPAAPPAQSRIDPHHPPMTQPRRDVKRASAGDKDE